MQTIKEDTENHLKNTNEYQIHTFPSLQFTVILLAYNRYIITMNVMFIKAGKKFLHSVIDDFRHLLLPHWNLHTADNRLGKNSSAVAINDAMNFAYFYF